MEIQVDISDVDDGVVDQIVFALCCAMRDADHIEPTVAECICAFRELIDIVLAGDDTILH